MKIYEQTTNNRRKSWLLLLGFFAIMFVLGVLISMSFGAGMFGAAAIMVFALIYAVVMYYWLGSTLILSVIYWLYWINRRLSSPKVKITASVIIIFMLAAGLLILWNMVILVSQLLAL